MWSNQPMPNWMLVPSIRSSHLSHAVSSKQSGEIRFERGSRLADIYGVDTATEEYHCNYGLSASYSDRMASGPLRVGGRDAQGEVRAIELDGHPFFVATLFQPERSALVNRQASAGECVRSGPL